MIFKVIMTKGFAAVGIFAIAAFALVTVFIAGNRLASSPKTASPSTPIKVLGSFDAPNSDLERYLTVETALLGVADNVSLYFRDLVTSNEITIDPTRAWIPASTIKSFVVPEAFRQKRLGIIDFNDNVVISAKNVVPTELETDDFPRLREGVVVTIGQLVSAMIEQSDNTAYNTLLDILDRRNINLTLRNLGITETVVGEKLNLDDEQFAIDLNVPGRQPITTTAKDLATLFNLMYNHKIPDSETMLSIFKNQKINYMIPSLLPNNLIIAHKTGEWAPIYHDGGIVYKQDNPFILTVFTNSNDPSIISRIAKVAYFQDAKSVGQKLESGQENSGNKSASSRPKYSLALSDLSVSRVLAAKNYQKLPKITAADLGITQQDLKSDVASGAKINKALIGPTSPLYGIKRFIDYLRLQFAPNEESKLSANISLSKNRLAEFETAMTKGDYNNAQNLLSESEQNLKQSVVASQSTDTKDENLLKIKEANDLHFKALAQVAQDLPDDKKEGFVNIVYEFVKNNKREVKPVINKHFATTKSTSQEVIIGTVEAITNNTATLKFEDGSTKEVVVSTTTPTRDFTSASPDEKTQIHINSKVAIVGQTIQDGKIIPQFILRNIPKNLPDKRNGTVIEVDPNKNSLKIVTPEGIQQVVKVDNQTQIQSKDTGVSLEGIKAGSQVTVFVTPDTTSSSGTKPSPAQGASSNNQPTLHANTVTVIKNDSGVKETKNSPANTKPSQDKRSTPKPPPPAATSPPSSESKKPEPKKS